MKSPIADCEKIFVLKRRVFAGILNCISKKHNTFRTKFFRKMPKVHFFSVSFYSPYSTLLPRCRERKNLFPLGGNTNSAWLRSQGFHLPRHAGCRPCDVWVSAGVSLCVCSGRGDFLLPREKVPSVMDVSHPASLGSIFRRWNLLKTTSPAE